MERAEIYYADLNPTIGSEQGGIRPVLIIQNNKGNLYSPTVIVATITTKPKAKMPTHVYIGEYPKPSFAQLEQIKTIDKKRLKEYVGKVSDEYIKKIDIALQISVGI